MANRSPIRTLIVDDEPLARRGLELRLGEHADVEISPQGAYLLDKRRLTLDQLEAALVSANKANPNTVVYIRADENGKNKDLYAVIDRCQRNGITRFSLRTEPSGTR